MAKILAVDDEPSIRKLVGATLKARGHEVIEAGDGEEALSLARVHKPDLVLLDVMMPGMTGLEVSQKLRADKATSSIPIMFLTAMGAFDSQLKALQDGSEDYVTKPFTPSDLAERVEIVLDPSRREELSKRRGQDQARLRTMLDIMKRDQA